MAPDQTLTGSFADNDFFPMHMTKLKKTNYMHPEFFCLRISYQDLNYRQDEKNSKDSPAFSLSEMALAEVFWEKEEKKIIVEITLVGSIFMIPT